MTKKHLFALFLMYASLCSQAQTSDTTNDWLGELKVGIRTQKTQKLYWENGFSADFTSPKIIKNKLHLGFSYVTSRLRSAMGANAIKQDNYVLNFGYFFRDQKKLQPFTRINTGFFYADYESDIFDELPNTALLFSLDAGISYKLKAPFTFHVSAGYNFTSGTGAEGPGTLYPIYYQMSILYTILNKK